MTKEAVRSGEVRAGSVSDRSQPGSVAHPSGSGVQRSLVIVAGLLFIGWIAWLVYEVVTTANPIVVSRPQILVAPIIVEAHVADRKEGIVQVSVTQVYRGQELLGVAAGTPPGDLRLPVAGLESARGWHGPGEYILALVQSRGDKDQRYQLVPVPFSPGASADPDAEERKPAIYPVTPSTRSQLEEALK